MYPLNTLAAAVAVESPRQVLVLDPSSSGRRLATELQAMGVPARALAQADALLSACAASLPHAVIVELQQADGSGVALIRQLKRLYPNLRLIALTAQASVPQATAALRAGAHDCMTKPVAPAILLDALGTPLAAHTVMTPSLDEIKRLHIADTLSDAGSISAAARTLGIERRSFRRMVQRYAALASLPADHAAPPVSKPR